jgi:hypothetical protein
MDLWFRRDLVRSLLAANPEARDAWVQDALRPWGVTTSSETVRRDRILWGLPSGREQRLRRARGHRYVQPLPASGSVGSRLIGELLRGGPGTIHTLSERTSVPRGTIRAALKAHPMLVCHQSLWCLLGT